ncbi:uncharacterized protein JCM15063_004898 [Sporobolomyces koalae]|uniref:uncharacterized protein n=1 Tax=Sporobolomyces koalae TaxID=500713 RepID=UPI003171BDBE
MSKSFVLPPPPPRFAQTFDSDRDQVEPVTWQRSNGHARMEEEETRQVGSETHIDWDLKTDAELHVQKLEDRLKELSQHRGQAASSPLAFNQAQPFEDEVDDSYRSEDDGAKENDEAEAAGHDGEGTALLSIAEGDFSDPHQTTSEHDDGDDVEEEEEEEGDDEADLSDIVDDSRPGPKRPHRPSGLTAAQRISFSNSVRISGGIRSRPHKHRPPIDSRMRRSPSVERTNPLARDPRPQNAPSPLLVASVTSSNANTPARAASPAGRAASLQSLAVLAPRPRRLSSSSSFTHASYAYSVSPGSQVPSRGSSPCSSIYAPLQPPSKHTPNPHFVRPSPRLQRQQSASGLSFQEYLRKGYDALEASDEDGDDSDALVPKSPGYRELVDRQRQKRMQWEQRKRKRTLEDRRKHLELGEQVKDPPSEPSKGFWSSLKAFFGSPEQTTFGSGIGRAGGAFGSPTVVFRQSSRLPSSRNHRAATLLPVNKVRTSPLSSSSVPAPTSPPVRPKSILSTSSRIPSENLPPLPPPPPPRTRTPRTPSTPVRSTCEPPQLASPRTNPNELDGRFGSRPFRYLNPSYIWYKLHELFEAVKGVFETASKGLAKQKERERLVKQQQQQHTNRGYQAV